MSILTSSQLQSLIARNSDDIRAVHRDITATAAMLTPEKYRYEEIEETPGTYRKVAAGGDDYNRPFYAILSKLQSKRRRLEELQRSLKLQRKAANVGERAQQVLADANITLPPGLDGLVSIFPTR